jgi:hypothetical protein
MSTGIVADVAAVILYPRARGLDLVALAVESPKYVVSINGGIGPAPSAAWVLVHKHTSEPGSHGWPVGSVARRSAGHWQDDAVVYTRRYSIRDLDAGMDPSIALAEIVSAIRQLLPEGGSVMVNEPRILPYLHAAMEIQGLLDNEGGV